MTTLLLFARRHKQTDRNKMDPIQGLNRSLKAICTSPEPGSQLIKVANRGQNCLRYFSSDESVKPPNPFNIAMTNGARPVNYLRLEEPRGIVKLLCISGSDWTETDEVFRYTCSTSMHSSSNLFSKSRTLATAGLSKAKFCSIIKYAKYDSFSKRRNGGSGN